MTDEDLKELDHLAEVTDEEYKRNRMKEDATINLKNELKIILN